MGSDVASTETFKSEAVKRGEVEDELRGAGYACPWSGKTAGTDSFAPAQVLNTL